MGDGDISVPQVNVLKIRLISFVVMILEGMGEWEGICGNGYLHIPGLPGYTVHLFLYVIYRQNKVLTSDRMARSALSTGLYFL